jgi:hypothetical protein
MHGGSSSVFAAAGRHLLAEFRRDVTPNGAKAGRWIAIRQRELAVSGVRLQTFQKPRLPRPPDFAQAGESGLLANELFRAFKPHHEFFQAVSVLLRDFHEYLSATTRPLSKPYWPAVREDE